MNKAPSVCVWRGVFFFFKCLMEMPIIHMKAAVLRRACQSPTSLSLREVLFGHVSRLTTSCGGQSFEQVLASHWGCVIRTVIRLANLELTVHISIHPVVSCSQSNQDDLVCSVQVVVAICGVNVMVLLMPFSCSERLDDGLSIYVGDRFVMLIKATSLLD